MRRGSQRNSPDPYHPEQHHNKRSTTSSPKKKEPPKVIPGELNLFFALSDLPASLRKSTTTDSVDCVLLPFF